MTTESDKKLKTFLTSVKEVTDDFSSESEIKGKVTDIRVVKAGISDSPLVLSSLAKRWINRDVDILEIDVKVDFLDKPITFAVMGKKKLFKIKQLIEGNTLVIGESITLFRVTKNDKSFYDLFQPSTD